MSTVWTDEQNQAIHLRGCNLLVSAAAGSGKTAVLVERIFAMLTDEQQPLSIDDLLVVTFTNAAAAEMKERVQQRLMQSLSQDPRNAHLARQLASMPAAQIMTIDSFCLQVVRSHFHEIDLDPAFTVGETTELQLMREDVAQTLMEDLYEAEDTDFLTFTECYATGKTDQGITELILNLYKYAMSMPQPDRWLSDCLQSFDVADKEQLSRTAPVQFLLADCKTVIAELTQSVQDALLLCAQEDGPLFYADALQEDLLLLQRLSGAASFNDYHRGLADLSFQRLSAKRMPSASEQKKEQVKAVRENVRKTLRTLQEDFFSVDAERAAATLRMVRPQMETLVRMTREFSKRYAQEKRNRNLLDFDDLEHFALQILTCEKDGILVPTPAAQELSARYAEIFIDEYQDSNQLQETILNSISRERAGTPNMFMVGDVKQSIYSFRLARPELFMEKYRTYPQKGKGYRRIKLHKNFRSRPQVLDSVNALFGRLMNADLGGVTYDADAALYAGADYPDAQGKAAAGTDGMRPAGDTETAETAYRTEVLLVVPQTDQLTDVVITQEEEEPLQERQQDGQVRISDRQLEAYAAANRIRSMTDSRRPLLVTDQKSGQLRPVRYGDIVILLRTGVGWTDIYTKILAEEGIPAAAETSTGFFSAPEVVLILDVLRVIDNPRQDIALAAVLCSPVGDCTDEELAMIRSISVQNGPYGTMDLYDCCMDCRNAEQQAVLAKLYGAEAVRILDRKLTVFFTLLESLRTSVAYTPVYELLTRIYDETGYYAYACALPAGKQRRANLDMLVQKAVDYEHTTCHGLFSFIRYIEKLHTYEVDFGEAQAGAQADCVRILTIHKSKGLEYPVVFVAGLGKRFNRQETYGPLLFHSDFGLGPDAVDLKLRVKTPTLMKRIVAKKTVQDQMGEELRVLYVAMTRAKEKLVLLGTVHSDMSKTKQGPAAAAADGTGFLPFSARVGASCALDWIVGAIGGMKDAPFTVRQADTEVILKNLAQRSLVYTASRRILTASAGRQAADPAVQDTVRAYLGWEYPYRDILHLHTKVSVSELKNLRQLQTADEEVRMFAEYDALPESPGTVSAELLPEDHAQAETFLPSGGDNYGQMMKPAAADRQTDIAAADDGCEEARRRAALRGTTVHVILQNLAPGEIYDLTDVRRLVRRLCMQGKITQEGALLVYLPGILDFARSELAQRMWAADACGQLYREKQFVIGVPAARILAGTPGEEMILVQGIIDAWFVEDEEIVLVDYKTDAVTDQGESLIRKYRVQLDTYALALEQMTHRRVKEKLIYSLRLGRELKLPHRLTGESV